MKRGDLRETSPREVGECYICRRLFRLDDLTPVSSQSSADWRFVCPLCRDVARLNRPGGIERTIIFDRMIRDSLLTTGPREG